MSGKLDKHEASKSAGSKVLRKAKSFRDDLKNRISSARRSPSISSKGSISGLETPPLSPLKSPSKKKLLRGTSFSEGSKAEKLQSIKKSEYGDDEEVLDIDRIDAESKKVFRALRYIQDVVDKNILQLLPGSATVVLETVMEVYQLLTSYFINQESTVLMSTYNHVFQNLANLIRWADHVYLHDGESFDRENACAVIRAVNDGMVELLNLSRDKLRNKNSYSSKTLPKPPNKNKTAESSQRNSLPDSLPLTPREKEILEKTALSRSADGMLDEATLSADDLPSDLPPPPKPPLPQKWASHHGPEDEVFNEDAILDDPEAVPPPLPPKRNSSGRKSQLDDIALGRHSTSSSENPDSGLKTFSVTHTSATKTTVVNGQESSNTTCHTEISGDPSVTLELVKMGKNDKKDSGTYDASSDAGVSGGSTPINQSPHQSMSLGIKPYHLMLPSMSPTGGTPLSQSPTSSVGSVMSASSEDLLDDKSSCSESASPVKKETRCSVYDNFGISKPGEDTDIVDLTDQINTLTTDIEKHAAVVETDGKPPPIPQKERYKKVGKATQRGVHRALSPGFAQSQYDNVAASPTLPATRSEPISTAPAVLRQGELGLLRSSKSSTAVTHQGKYRATTTAAMIQRSMQVTVSHETFSSSETFSSGGEFTSEDSLQKPPPIPLKKKHVEAYMQTFGQCSSPQVLPDISRHSVHSVNFYMSQWCQHQMDIFQPGAGHHYPRSNTVSQMSDISSRSSDVFSVTSGSSSEESQHMGSSLPNLPPKQSQSEAAETQVVMRKKESKVKPPDLPARNKNSKYREADTASGQLALPDKTHKYASAGATSKSEDKEEVHPSGSYHYSDQRSSAPVSTTSSETTSSSSNRNSSPPPDVQKDEDSDFAELTTLDDVDVNDQLIRKKPGEDGPDMRGGSVDALIVHATIAGKNDFMYQEAFLTTYRTFISPSALIEKLLYRYNRFSRMNDVKKKKLSRNAFSLLIRVVDELCTEVDEDVIQVLMDLVCQLLCDGELMLARALRKKVLEICEYHKRKLEASHHTTLLPSFQLTAKQHCLTDFRSQQVAEQMTLLDAALFQKIEIPEVLLWSKEQSEEHSPNLTKFTEHFNKMSYWCRTRVLEQDDPREREKYLMKFIKIMKHLRKYNNFNSYLAILSALDSAPVRRLEWQKQNLEALREFCDLIDSSSAFRAYRQALAATEPPCIPYIGLILQDLTFVHIGNPDTFQEGSINFAKRWQQFNILDNMRRFKQCNYVFKKVPKIIAYFNNFDNALCEESLWHRSQMIKPKPPAKKKVLTN